MLQVGGQERIGEIPQPNPVAREIPQIEEGKNRGGDVRDRPGDGLQQQPTANNRASHRQDGGREFRRKADARHITAVGPLGGDQQQLHQHQGGLAGRADPLGAGEVEVLEQPQVDHHPEGNREPPAPQTHHQQAKGTGGVAAQQALGGGSGARGRNQGRSAAIKKSGSAAAKRAWLPRRCIR